MGTPLQSARTGFIAAKHGFPFANCFPCGKPVWTVPTPVWRIPIGDASKGLCGGMVFAALDHYHVGLPVPLDPEVSGLHQYLARRLWSSFHVPWGVARIYRWMGRPDSARTSRGLYPTSTVPYLTTQREWPLIRSNLDRGEPTPLMLIKTDSRNPWEMAQNHQVLATGYDENLESGDVAIRLYEPNYPVPGCGTEEVELRFNTREFDGRKVFHAREGESVRGFFLNRYVPDRPPILG